MPAVMLNVVFMVGRAVIFHVLQCHLAVQGGHLKCFYFGLPKNSNLFVEFSSRHALFICSFKSLKDLKKFDKLSSLLGVMKTRKRIDAEHKLLREIIFTNLANQ